MAIPSPISEQSFPRVVPSASVDPGRSDYLSTIWRLTRMELYKVRHRTYSRVIFWLLPGLVVLVTILLGFTSRNEANSSAASMVPEQCSAQVTTGCTTQHYSQAQRTQVKEADLQRNASLLGFPGSLTFVMMVFSNGLVALLGLLLLAPIMGTEYSLGTIRLLFTRGPTRLQCLLGKACAGLIYTAGVMMTLALAYIIVGMLVYPMAGVPYSYTFGHFHDANFGAVFGNTLWLFVISIGYWYAYVVLAFFFGTLGRSTAAALGGVFAWFFLEEVIPHLMSFLMNFATAGLVHAVLKAIPDYLFLANFNVLAQNRLHALTAPNSASPASDLHAAMVVGVYLVLLIGVSCVITMRRDVTN